MTEIRGKDPPETAELVQMFDSMLLSQVGTLDAGSSSGLFDLLDYVLDVSMDD
jgi:hypothetical protein